MVEERLDGSGSTERHAASQRLSGIARAAFIERFGAAPRVVVRAPGRVNLIGEHTDYNGLPVLPFAIAQSHYIAAGKSDGPLFELANVDPRYGAKAFALDDLAAMSPAGQWDNYLRAALLGLIDAGLLRKSRLKRGLRFMVASDLPSGVGISSSSALVVGFALSALEIHGVPYDRLRLAEILAEAEHYVGTRGGGMDQTTSLLGKRGHALRIDFFPLKVEAVSSTTDWQSVQFFLTDSGVRVEKSGEGRWLYNRRPIECRLALALFKARALENAQPKFQKARYLGDLVKPPIELSHDAISEIIKIYFDQSSYSVGDLARRLSIGEEDVREIYLKTAPGAYFPEPPEGFKLRQRATHVFSEAQRVAQAVEALRAADWPRLGALMNASHASCRDLYEISSPELERLVESGRQAGAYGSRLTGAGFGGCALHLVPADQAQRFEAAMKSHLGDRLLLRVAPSDGAEIFQLTQ